MPIRLIVNSRRAFIYSILLLFVVFLSAEQTEAQPGEPPNPELIVKELLERRDKICEEISHTPSRASLYAERGNLYSNLYTYSRTDDLNRSDGNYAEKGLADYSTAIELDPQPDFFAARGNLHHTIMVHQLSHSAPAEAQIEILLRSPHFDKAVSDHLRATMLIDDTQASKRYSHYMQLSYFYSFRATYLCEKSELIKAMRRQGEKYTVWEDFDTSISYFCKTDGYFASKPAVLELYLNKGDLAYGFGEYEVALEAYKSDEEYLGQNYHQLCEDDPDNPEECENKKRRWVLVFSLKRAKSYLKLGQAEKALAELDTYFIKADTYDCPQPFQLRAEAYRQLGKIEMALADEQTVREMPTPSNCAFQ